MTPATPDHIKDALRNCKTCAEVHSVSDKYRARVMALANDPAEGAMYHQIVNLKAYRLQMLRADSV